jgi:hypothetical protein
LKKKCVAKRLRNTQNMLEENMRNEFHVFLIWALQKDVWSAVMLRVVLRRLSPNRNVGGRHSRVTLRGKIIHVQATMTQGTVEVQLHLC